MIYLGFRHQVRNNMHNRLDAEAYSPEEVTVLSIPFSLPYPLQGETFQKLSGEFEHNGEFYKLIKQKLQNDTLYIVCIKDQEEKKLALALADYTRLTNDLPTHSQQALNFLAKIFKDYSISPSYNVTSPFFVLHTLIFIDREFSLLETSYPIESPPPQRVC